MLIKKIFRDEKGAVLPLVALFIFLVALGVTALVVDAGMLYSERRAMVAAADAGALAGAQELDKGTTLSEVLTITRNVSIKNGADSGNLTGSIQTINGNKAILNDGKIIIEVDRSLVNKYNRPYVEVTTNKNTKHFFARIFGDSETDVKAAAVAGYEKIAFQEFVFPLAALYSDFYKDGEINKNVPIYLHEDKPQVLGNSSWSGLLDIDGKGANAIGNIIENRVSFPVTNFLKEQNDLYYIDVANGWKTFGTSVNNLIAKSYTLSLANREKYLTGYIPVLKDISILPNSSKDVPIYALAEFVVVDYADKSKSKWLTSNYTYEIDPSTGEIEVNYDNYVSGKNLPENSGKDTIMGYFTGNFIDISNAYTGEINVFLFK